MFKQVNIKIPELGFKSKQILSWMLAGELLKKMNGDFYVGITKLFDGHYDCLTLYSSNTDKVIYLNRSGTSARVFETTIPDVWSHAAISPEKGCDYMLDLAKLPQESQTLPHEKDTLIRCVTSLAAYLNNNFNREANVFWLNDVLKSKGVVPPEWESIPGPCEGRDWRAWLFVIQHGETPIALVNLRLNSAVDLSGNEWLDWKRYASESSLNIQPIAYNVRVFGKNQMEFEVRNIHPSLLRRTIKIYKEEGLQVDVKAVSELTGVSEAKIFWGQVDSSSTYLATLKNLD